MIETEQTVLINVPIERIWDYVTDIQKWASMMPGMRDCAVTSPDDSLWTLKVGVSGLVRTVKVAVHVDQWDGPERVFFTYKLQGDPVEGGGTYTAARISPGETEVKLNVRVVGSGSMAPMWEAMGRPLLPQLAKAFANQLKTDIEAALAGATPEPAPPKAAFWARLASWLRRLFRPTPA